MSENKPRFRLLVAVFAVASMIGGSFVVVANAAPGKGKGGGRPGPKPSPSARPEKPERPERPERPAKAIQTRLGFRLDTRHIEEGGSVMGTAKLVERVGKGFAPFAGQTLHVFVDETEQDTVTTDSEGKAVVTATGDVGGHVVRVVYAGDATHRPAKRAQGFHVGSATAEDGDKKEGCPPPPPEDGGGDEVQAFGPGRGGPDRGGPERERKPHKPCRDHDDHEGDKEDPAKEEDDEDDDDDKEDVDDDESTDDSVDTTTDGVDSGDDGEPIS